MARCSRRVWVSIFGAFVLIVFAGVIIQPEGAVRKYSIGNLPTAVSDNDNALRVAKAAFARYRPFQNLLIVSFRLEGKEAWDVRATAGCNDKWIISARTLFGFELGKAAYLCGGIDSYWI
jgi:hypothetical protein